MKLFAASLRVELKRILLSRWFIILLLVMILVLAGAIQYSHAESPGIEIKVGVVFEEQDDFARSVFQKLQRIDIATFDDLGECSLVDIERAVASRTYETVYFLEPNLEEMIASGLFQGSIPSLVLENSNSPKLIDEWLFSAVITEAAPNIAIREIENILDISPDISTKEIMGKIQWYQENNTYVEAVTHWEGGPPQLSKGTSLAWVRIVHGILAVFLFLLFASSLSSLISHLHQVDTGLTSRKRLIYRLASLVSHLISGFLFGGIGLCFISIFDKTLLRTVSLEAAALAAYLLLLSGIVLLLAMILQDSDMVFSGVIFAFLSMLLLGGVLFAPREISGWLEGIAHFFPTYYYLDGLLSASCLPLLPLFFIGISLTFLSLFFSLLPHKKYTNKKRATG